MAGDARQAPRLRPAAVAVHDDGDMAGHGAASGAVSGRLRVGCSRRLTSAGFPFPWRRAPRRSPRSCSSVSFCTSVSRRLCSSSLMSLLLLVGLELVHAVAADVAHRDPRLFGILCRRAWRAPCGAPRSDPGSAGADVLAVDDRVEAEPGVADRLLDRADIRACPRPGPRACAARARRRSRPG